MANPIRNFRCDDDIWNRFQDYCQSQHTEPSQMLLALINSCLETDQESIEELNDNRYSLVNNTITQILNLVYDCKTKIEEQNYKISQLTDNIHDLEMKSKSNETNINILLENNQQLENSHLNFEEQTDEIVQKVNSFRKEYYNSLENIYFHLNKIELNNLTKSQLIGLLKQEEFEYPDSLTKDKLIKLCQEHGLSAIESRDKIKLPNLPKSKKNPE